MAKCFRSIFIKKRILLFIVAVCVVAITVILLICQYDLMKIELFPNEVNLNIISGNYKHADRNDLLIKCSNLHQVRLGQKIGHGTTKQVYSATFVAPVNLQKIIVKMVTLQSPDVSKCISVVRSNSIKYYQQGEPPTFPKMVLYGNPHFLQRSLTGNYYPSVFQQKSRSFVPEMECFTSSNRKLMKEILISMQLNHPGFVKFLGYCSRGEMDYSTSLSEHSTISAYEVGVPFHVDFHLSSLSIHQKLNTLWMLADLLEYLHLSPLGSLRIADFKETHFVTSPSDNHYSLPFKNSHTSMIKMIDLDDLESAEPRCFKTWKSGQLNTNVTHLCGYNLSCTDGRCKGFNYMFNMDKMNQLFFSKLLQPEVNETRESVAWKGLQVTRVGDSEKITGNNAQLSKKLTYNLINSKSPATEYLLSKAKIREKLDKIEFSPSRLKNELVELCHLYRQLERK